MKKIDKILLPLDLEDASVPMGIIRQAGALARHFQSEILILHVIKVFPHFIASGAAHEALDREIAQEKEKLSKCLGPELQNQHLRQIVLKGDPAREIVRTAQEENAGLIVMPTHGYGSVERVFVGSVTNKVLHYSSCPVWTAAHLDQGHTQGLAIRNVLCAVDFSAHSPKTIRLAQEVASEFGAALTLAHITPAVEIYGPGGYHILSEMKEELIGSANKQMSKLQEELGTKASVFIGSGDISKMVRQAAMETKADLIVAGSRALGNRLGTTAYGIIRESQVPVLSV